MRRPHLVVVAPTVSEGLVNGAVRISAKTVVLHWRLDGRIGWSAGRAVGRPAIRTRVRAVRSGMLAYVKRTTVKIPDALDARLRHEAARRGTTIADISREALEAYLGHSSAGRRLGAAGAGHSGRSDASERIEEILAAEVVR